MENIKKYILWGNSIKTSWVLLLIGDKEECLEKFNSLSSEKYPSNDIPEFEITEYNLQKIEDHPEVIAAQEKILLWGDGDLLHEGTDDECLECFKQEYGKFSRLEISKNNITDICLKNNTVFVKMTNEDSVMIDNVIKLFYLKKDCFYQLKAE